MDEFSHLHLVKTPLPYAPPPKVQTKKPTNKSLTSIKQPENWVVFFFQVEVWETKECILGIG
jgi:hypothetical protein